MSGATPQAIDTHPALPDPATWMSTASPAFRWSWLAVSAAACVLAGCASDSATVASAPRVVSAPRTVARPPVAQQARDPVFLSIPGLEGVIGATAPQLVAQFGEPRLDVVEGDARKLQYVGAACVLDIYLYPTSRSREPLATYLDARRASDGQDVDRAACVRAMKR